MSTYKGIQGTAVTNYAGDKPGVVDGEVWYDSTAAAFKYQYPNVTAAGAWSTGGSLNTARSYSGGTGIQTAALCFGGDLYAQTEKYNGTSWTEVNDLILLDMVWLQMEVNTSTLAFGGHAGPGGVVATESWNGTNLD
jgi:hypothetical protein